MQSREELRALTAHAESVKEQERRLVARDIHDEIGSTLTGMKADLAWLKKRFAADGDVAAKLTSMGELVDGAGVQTANRIIQSLRPGILDYGIAPALEWQASDFAAPHGPGGGLRDQCGGPGAGHRAVDRAVPRVPGVAHQCRQVREGDPGGNRTVRATPTSVHPGSAWDNGVGLADGALAKATSFGIRGMMERVRALGGWLDINGAPGKGTTVMLSIPRRRPRAAPRFPRRRRNRIERRRHNKETTDDPQVLIADDHAIVRKGMVQIASESREIEIRGEAKDHYAAADEADARAGLRRAAAGYLDAGQKTASTC